MGAVRSPLLKTLLRESLLIQALLLGQGCLFETPLILLLLLSPLFSEKLLLLDATLLLEQGSLLPFEAILSLGRQRYGDVLDGSKFGKKSRPLHIDSRHR